MKTNFFNRLFLTYSFSMFTFNQVLIRNKGSVLVLDNTQFLVLVFVCVFWEIVFSSERFLEAFFRRGKSLNRNLYEPGHLGWHF